MREPNSLLSHLWKGLEPPCLDKLHHLQAQSLGFLLVSPEIALDDLQKKTRAYKPLQS